MKTKIFAITLAIAAAAPAIADDFTYVSGGLMSQLHKGELARYKIVDKKGIEGKNDAFGFYLNGSLGINDHLFVEGRLHDTSFERQVLLGIGGHYPVAQWANFYVLAGISKRDLTYTYVKSSAPINSLIAETDTEEMELANVLDGGTSGYRDNIQPTIELGAKLHINEEAGARVSYRYAQFANKVLGSKYKHLHEVHLSSYRQVAENCTIEFGYNFARSSIPIVKNIKDHKITAGIRYSF